MIFKNPRNLLWLIPLAMLLTSPVWKPFLADFLRPPGGAYETPSLLTDDKPAQRFIIDTFSITMSNKGRVEWVINADRAFTGQSDQEVGMIGVDALYTDKNNDKTYITSSKGKYDLTKRHLVLIDNVVIRKPAAKQEMFTDLLYYYGDTKKVISPGDVEIKSPDYSVKAGRLDYDVANNLYKFSNRVAVDL